MARGSIGLQPDRSYGARRVTGLDDHSAMDVAFPDDESPRPGGPQRPATGGIWSAERADLHEALVQLSPLCGDLYAHAVDTLGEQPLGAGALVVAAHALRELVNMLPSVLGDEDLPPRSEEGPTRDALVAAWRDFRGASDGAGPDFDGPTPALRDALWRALDEFADLQDDIKANAAGRRSALVHGQAGARVDAAVVLVRRAINRIEGFRHPGGHDVGGWHLQGDAFTKDLEVIERVLQSRIGSFFDVVDQLMGVVERANAVKTSPLGDETWDAPTSEDVSAALLRLGDLQHQRVFFSRLANPLWLTPLDRAGVFDIPPAERADDAGRVRWIPWPPGDYLVAMSGRVPDTVASILLRVVSRQSAPWVKGLLVSAALQMPPAPAARVAKRVSEYAEQATTSQIDPDVIDLVEKLAAGGNQKQAVRLAQALLRPRASEQPERLGRRDVWAAVDTTWYDDALTKVVTALAGYDKLLSMLAAWLEQHELVSGAYDPTRDCDFSSTWRPSIGDHPQNYRFQEIGEALVDALRDTALAQGEDPATVIEILERRNVPILRRIVFYVLAQRVAYDSRARSLAVARLLDPRFLRDEGLYHEYLELASAVLPTATDADYRSWEQMVLDGPQLDDDLKRGILAHPGDGETPEQALALHMDVWQLERLSAVGADALRGRARERLAVLVAEHGEPEHPSFLGWHESWSGEESPFTADELIARDPRNVLAILRTWEAPEPRMHGPSRGGLGLAFSAAVAARAGDYSRLAAEALTVPDEYLGNYLSGLRDAAVKHTDLDWRALLDTSAAFGPPVDPAEPDASRWHYLRREMCAVLEAGATREPGAIPGELLPVAARVVARWLDHSQPSVEHEGQYGGSNMDPLTLSLNTTRPRAIRTLIQLAVASFETTPEDRRPGPLVGEVTHELTRLITPHRDPSLAVAAAFGEGFARLLWIAPEWTTEHAERLLTEDAFGDVVATTALCRCHTSRKLIDALEAKMAKLIRRAGAGEQITSGLRMGRGPIEAIGDHVITLLLWGVHTVESPLVRLFFEAAPVEARASALGHLGWRLLHTEVVSDEPRERAQELWQARADAVRDGTADAAELSQIHWWVHCGKFPTNWWLPQLEFAAGATAIDERSHLGEHLAEASDTFPAQAITALDLLVRPADYSLAGRMLTRHAPTIIARAIDCEDPEARRRGREVMDRLGRQGHISIAEQVEEARHAHDEGGLERG